VDDADRIDLYTNKDGNHIIVQTSSQLKYYLYSYAGYQIRSVTIDNSISENPRLSCITGYLDTVYVLWKEGSYIYGKRTTNAGQNWTNLDNNSMSESYSNGLEVWAEHGYLHTVWSESEDGYDPYETYHRSIKHTFTSWGTKKQVTDYSGEEGGFPSVTTSPTRIHVAYTVCDDLNPEESDGVAKNRDKYNANWQTPIVIFDDAGYQHDDAARSYVIASSDKLHTFYYDNEIDFELMWTDLYHKSRTFESTSWGSATLIHQNTSSNSTPVDMAVSANDSLHIVFDGEYYNEYTGIWETIYDYSTGTFNYNQKISANSNDVYVVWIQNEDETYTLMLKQRDYVPLAPQNLYVDFSVGDHPTVHWDANREADLKGYHIYRSIPQISENKRLTTNPITATYYVDYDYLEGETYQAYYYAKAVDQYNNLSPSSNSYGVWVMPTKQGQLSQIGTMVPTRFELFQNYPNPFNPSTNIMFGLPKDDRIELNIYAVNGQRIIQLVNEQLEKGYHTIVWNGQDGNGNSVASGVYIYEILANGKRLVDKMFLMK
jgi:hypothetical protein